MVNTILPPSCNPENNWQGKITLLKALHSYCVPCHALLLVGNTTKNQLSSGLVPCPNINNNIMQSDFKFILITKHRQLYTTNLETFICLTCL